MPCEHILERELPHSPRNLIGESLRAIRQRARPRISQEDLCGRVARFGVILTRTQIAKIEAVKRPVFDYELRAFALALNVKIEVLIQLNGAGAIPMH